eukprot:COSAG01_NODE_1056_length_11893_cov_439.683332_8_plen_88_part_00
MTRSLGDENSLRAAFGAAMCTTATATAASASQQTEQPQTEQPQTEQHIPCTAHPVYICIIIGAVSQYIYLSYPRHYCCQGCVLCFGI